jgi:hypothetical protein
MNFDFRFEITAIFYLSQLFRLILLNKPKTRFQDHEPAEVVVTHLNLGFKRKQTLR